MNIFKLLHTNTQLDLQPKEVPGPSEHQFSGSKLLVDARGQRKMARLVELVKENNSNREERL